MSFANRNNFFPIHASMRVTHAYIHICIYIQTYLSACAPVTTQQDPCLLGCSLEPRRTHLLARSRFVTTYIIIAPLARFVSPVCIGSFIYVAMLRVTHLHAHVHDDASRGQARRRRRRFTRSSPTTTIVNEIVGSVSANYRVVPAYTVPLLDLI